MHRRSNVSLVSEANQDPREKQRAALEAQVEEAANAPSLRTVGLVANKFAKGSSTGKVDGKVKTPLRTSPHYPICIARSSLAYL